MGKGLGATQERQTAEAAMTQIAKNPRPAAEWLSAHMRRRCSQRGTDAQLLGAVQDWADVEIPVGRGAIALSVSAEAALEMRADGWRERAKVALRAKWADPAPAQE